MGRNDALILAERPAGWLKILYEQARCYFYSILAAEVTTVARYYQTCRFLASHQAERAGNEFYQPIQAPQKCWSCIEDDVGNQAALTDAIVVLEGDLQESVDVQELLQRLRQDLADGNRLLLVAYNSCFTWSYRITLKAGWCRLSVPRVFLTVRQLEDLARLTHFDIVRHRRCGYFPWRWFGAVDPFGDFELLFPAAQIGLQLINVPIPYKKRRYGVTNIRRFADGWRLFRMVLRGFRRISLGQVPARAVTE